MLKTCYFYDCKQQSVSWNKQSTPFTNTYHKKNLVASQHDIFFFIYDKHKYTQFVTTIWSFYCKNISLTVNRKINGEKGGVAGRRGWFHIFSFSVITVIVIGPGFKLLCPASRRGLLKNELCLFKWTFDIVNVSS